MSSARSAPRPTREWRKAIENELDMHSLGSDTIGNLHWKRHFPQIDTVNINSSNENGRGIYTNYRILYFYLMVIVSSK